MSAQPLKNYVSRGTQTDRSILLQVSSVCDTLFANASTPPFVDEPPVYPSSSSKNPYGNLPAEIAGSEAAYMQSLTSEILKVHPPLSSRQNHRLVGSRGHPSGALDPPKRLVSLPDILHSEALMHRQTRVVSMPESGKYATLGPHTLSQSSQTSLSFSTDAGSSNGSPGPKLLSHHQRTYPTDFPRTPSPPSSLESVMVSGNEYCDSGGLLQRSYPKDNGWISWASSPPRPIPALHGPLSLPYARCPS
ncbi:hypothetical protein GALMADRAFT_538007 [Galerina marginata CBS 339.88]|uniref:Uncharacterized protein n=1 Tax=Galerina marginata (strain CBS 339.88) TaxID=685588 RepID=A0A067SWD3_GALM3|nr:hypothetical protein GALMADRAFT_538007 [Galerina marginata CBS 339.88]